MITFSNEDCMRGMERYPENYFDLAIVDPPYYSGPERRHFYGRSKSKTDVFRTYNPSTIPWEVPTEEYFRELMRVSRHYIVWGCNYFNWDFTPGRTVWDKCNRDSTFSDAEIAATDLFTSVRLFPYLWNGMLQGKSITEGRIQRGNKAENEKRIHPTQKPINLYLYLLKKYAKPGDRILDTHVGSGSSLIACHRLGFDCVGFEIDKAYFEAAKKRLEDEMAQIRIESLIDSEIKCSLNTLF